MNTQNEKIELSGAATAVPDRDELAQQAKAPRRNRWAVMGVTAVVVVVGLAAGIAPRLRATSALNAGANELTVPTVAVTNAVRAGQAVTLSLPGEVRAYEETEIYARADGYLLRWSKDIGSHVKAGDLLAEIDTPELDQELNQAKASLGQARANLILARSSAERWQGLLKTHAVSEQEVDEKTGALAAREADMSAAEAAVSRLEKLASFKEVRAPFAGTITRRSVDAGALIRAGGNASALFKLAQIDRLRVRVNVPQAYLRDVGEGTKAQLRVAEYPGRVFTGTVARTSGAFDPTTRTLVTEIEVANTDGALFPGIHVDAELALAQVNPPVVAPSTSVITRSDGTSIATVDKDNAIRLNKVRLGRDLGRNVEVVEGLEEGSRIVTHPMDTLAEGMQVRVAGEATGVVAAPKLAKR